MNKSSLRGNAMLILAAMIWGAAFVAQSVGMDYVGPFTFNTARSVLGGLALLPVIWMRDKKGASPPISNKAQRKVLIIGGICCGTALAVGSAFQQMGVAQTTVGKAGFITALYIVIVPLLGILLGKKPGLFVWIGVGLAVGGMYLLCITEGFHMQIGDLLVLLCAVAFAVHILVIDHFSPKTDGVRMSCIQFFVCAALSSIPMFLFESPSISALLSAAAPILYAGVLSSGVGYTLQIMAQKNTDPTLASLLLSLESVFAVIAGWVLLSQGLSAREIFGCVLVFVAIILAQWPQKKLAV